KNRSDRIFFPALVRSSLVPELPFGNAVRETPVSRPARGPDAKREFRGRPCPNRSLGTRGSDSVGFFFFRVPNAARPTLLLLRRLHGFLPERSAPGGAGAPATHGATPGPLCAACQSRARARTPSVARLTTGMKG